MNNSSFRYALNTSLRGLVSLDYGMPSPADGNFEIVPADYSYSGVIYGATEYVKLTYISYIAADVLNTMEFGRYDNRTEFVIELEQYEDLMGI